MAVKTTGFAVVVKIGAMQGETDNFTTLLSSRLSEVIQTSSLQPFSENYQVYICQLQKLSVQA